MYTVQYATGTCQFNAPGRRPKVKQINRLRDAIQRANVVCENGTPDECVAAWREVDRELATIIAENADAGAT